MDIEHDCNSVLGRMMLAEVRRRQDERRQPERKYPVRAATYRHAQRDDDYCFEPLAVPLVRVLDEVSRKMDERRVAEKPDEDRVAEGPDPQLDLPLADHPSRDPAEFAPRHRRVWRSRFRRPFVVEVKHRRRRAAAMRGCGV